MSRRYLKDAAGCGKKIIKYFKEFTYNILSFKDAQDNPVQHSIANGSYKVMGIWRFNNQFGDFVVEFDVTQGKRQYKTGLGVTGIQLNTSNNSIHGFQRPLTYNNDPTLKNVFDRIIP